MTFESDNYVLVWCDYFPHLDKENHVNSVNTHPISRQRVQPHQVLSATTLDLMVLTAEILESSSTKTWVLIC